MYGRAGAGRGGTAPLLPSLSTVASAEGVGSASQDPLVRPGITLVPQLSAPSGCVPSPTSPDCELPEAVTVPHPHWSWTGALGETAEGMAWALLSGAGECGWNDREDKGQGCRGRGLPGAAPLVVGLPRERLELAFDEQNPRG